MILNRRPRKKVWRQLHVGLVWFLVTSTMLTGCVTTSRQARFNMLEGQAKSNMFQDQLEMKPVITQERAADTTARNGSKTKALEMYLEALGPVTDKTLTDSPQASANVRIRTKIIKLVHSMKKKMAVPEDANRFSLRGEVMMKKADTEGYAAPAAEFQKASDAAPWWPDAYYNLGVALEGAQDYVGAIQNLKLYLVADPHAPEAQDVQAKVYELEVSAEKQAQQEAQHQAAVKSQGESTGIIVILTLILAGAAVAIGLAAASASYK